MNRIRNNVELKSAYDMLMWLDECPTLPQREAIQREIKQAIRYYRDRCEIRNAHNRLVKDYGIDGFVELQALSSNIGRNDIESAEEDFMEHWYIDGPNVPWDCSGQMFTSWYKLVYRDNRWWAYHRVAVDC